MGCIVDSDLLPVSRQLPHPFRWLQSLPLLGTVSTFWPNILRSSGLGNYPETREEVKLLSGWHWLQSFSLIWLRLPLEPQTPPSTNGSPLFLFFRCQTHKILVSMYFANITCQAALFYAPRRIWKSCEGGLMASFGRIWKWFASHQYHHRHHIHDHTFIKPFMMSRTRWKQRSSLEGGDGRLGGEGTEGWGCRQQVGCSVSFVIREAIICQ